MARTVKPDSADSQFFIVLSDAAGAGLAQTNTYQILGDVTSGMGTVDAIAGAADQEHPTNPVMMRSIRTDFPEPVMPARRRFP